MMSWGPRSSTATSTPETNIAKRSTQRNKTAVAKSKSDLERSSTKERFIGWEGNDSYLQVDSIDIETWEKRHNTKPIKVPKEIKSSITSENGTAISYLPWEVYVCWTYNKCSTIPDYENYVQNSLSWKFKPEDEDTQNEDDQTCEQDSSSTKVDHNLPPPDTGNQESKNGDSRIRQDKTDAENIQNNSRAITKQNKSTSKVDCNDGNAEGVNPVLSVVDSRQSCISHSTPSFAHLDSNYVVEADRRVSSANKRNKSRGSPDRDVTCSKNIKDYKAVQQSSSRKLDKIPSPLGTRTTDKSELYLPLATDCESRSESKTRILIDPERFGVDKYTGFELPRTAHVNLGDLLANTPRLHRRLGTARGRDPTVYAALHGTEPRPRTPDILPPSVSPSNTPNGSSPVPSPQKTRSGTSSPSELPPVKNPRSPRNVRRGSNSENVSAMVSGSPHGTVNGGSTQGSTVVPQELFPSDELLPSVQSKPDNVWQAKLALLTYNHTKTSDTQGSNSNLSEIPSPGPTIGPGGDSDFGTTNGSTGGSPRMSEHGDRRMKQGKAVFFLQGTSAGLTLYSGPTRGPPGFRPQGQKTPLHRAMENTHKKLHGQHYHLFQQQQGSTNGNTGYGQYGQKDKHRRGNSAIPSSQRTQNNAKYDIPDPNTWPQQVQEKSRKKDPKTAALSAPTRRMHSATNNTGPGNATSNRHMKNTDTFDNNSNSTGKRRMSAQSYLGGDGRRHSSPNDFNSNIKTKFLQR